MKKIYNSPALLVVNLRTVHMMAESFVINSDPSNAITDGSDILTKEQNMTDVNIWDNEW